MVHHVRATGAWQTYMYLCVINEELLEQNWRFNLSINFEMTKFMNDEFRGTHPEFDKLIRAIKFRRNMDFTNFDRPSLINRSPQCLCWIWIYCVCIRRHNSSSCMQSFGYLKFEVAQNYHIIGHTSWWHSDAVRREIYWIM